MVIGNGNIAKAIIDKEDITFFASGVSDSSCVSNSQFEREENLLQGQNKNRHLVYFSSLSIYRSDNPYNKHKRNMEELVRRDFKSYTIVRLEVCAWAKNPTTIHNVFRKNIKQGITCAIEDTFRYVVDKSEFQYWLSLIRVGMRDIMNIPGKRYTIKEIYNLVEKGKL